MKAGEIDINPYLEKLGVLTEATLTDLKSVMKSQAALFVWNSNKRAPGVINITPPFNPDQGIVGDAALRAGQGRIYQQMSGILAPRALRGRRGITQVFGRKLSSPIYVPTKEVYPDVEFLYTKARNAKLRSQNNVTGFNIRKKGKYYVDKNKFNALLLKLASRVGLACACWYQAGIEADLLMRGVPKWVRAHTGVPGAGKFTFTDTSVTISLSSSLNYNIAIGMADKARRALQYRENALDRRLPYILAAAAKKARLAA